MLRAKGVQVVAGTDAGAAPTKRHGAAWRAVLEMVQADFPMVEALATATSEAAAVLGLGSVTGRLASGLSADLVVVEGDLVVDPSALSRPTAVLVRGSRPGS